MVMSVVLAALSGGELIIVVMAAIALVCMLSASVLGIFTRLARGRLGRAERETGSGRSAPPST